MPTWHPTTRRPRGNRHTKQNPSRLDQDPNNDLTNQHHPQDEHPRNGLLSTQTDPPHPAPTPPHSRTSTRRSEPTWHRLLGTLLSSQRPHAQPSDPSRPSRRQPLKLTRHDRGPSTTRSLIRAARSGTPTTPPPQVARREPLEGESPRDQPPTLRRAGVRSSLPGDGEEHYAALPGPSKP
jgi:hypothetical protein